MNREDIIRMAREAGIEWQSNKGITGRVRVTTCGSQSIEKIERLVQAAYAAGAAAEREACAKVCKTKAESVVQSNTNRGRVNQAVIYAAGVIEDCAAAIRARGQA